MTTAAPSTTPSATPSAGPSATTPTRVEAPKLADRLDDYLDGRSGDLGLELIDLRRGESFRFDAEEGYCYSTIKVLIVMTPLTSGRSSTSSSAPASAPSPSG